MQGSKAPCCSLHAPLPAPARVWLPSTWHSQPHQQARQDIACHAHAQTSERVIRRRKVQAQAAAEPFDTSSRQHHQTLAHNQPSNDTQGPPVSATMPRARQGLGHPVPGGDSLEASQPTSDPTPPQGTTTTTTTTTSAASELDPAFEPFNEDGSDPNLELEQSLPLSASNTRVRTAEYIISSVDVAQCPAPQFPEFAVIGRSNVGKSSLINMLTNNKRLAHVSKEPGKTRCINHFLINSNWYLVDLPGYGYAKTGYNTRDTFDKFTREFFLTRPSLALVYLLVDSSIEPQKVDLDYAAWLQQNKVPFAIIFTKGDKRKKGQPPCRENVGKFKASLLRDHSFPALPPVIITSAETGMGRTPLLHLTSSLRDALVATGKLDLAVQAWKRRQLYGPGAEVAVQPPRAQTGGAGQQGEVETGAETGGDAGVAAGAETGAGAAVGGGKKKGGSGAQEVLMVASKAKAGGKPGGKMGNANRFKSKVLPGDDVPLPQWKVRATERDLAMASEREQQQAVGAGAP